MNIWSVVLLAIAVSIDGFWSGFAFGLKKIKIPFVSLLAINICPIVCSMLTMLIGYTLQKYITFQSAQYFGAALLLFLGVFILKQGYKQKQNHKQQHKEKSPQHHKRITEHLAAGNLISILKNPLLADIDHENDIKFFEGLLLGFAVAMDASIAAFSLSLMGYNPFTTPFLFGLTHFILIGIGNITARQSRIQQIGEQFALLPGLILIVLSILRII
ncbi:sporulation membrane protein YtaF [Bacillota bacterium LX-D]|nr:sporulation membrane protein YtaF [Bacillota bacterium LX-D]